MNSAFVAVLFACLAIAGAVEEQLPVGQVRGRAVHGGAAATGNRAVNIHTIRPANEAAIKHASEANDANAGARQYNQRTFQNEVVATQEAVDQATAIQQLNGISASAAAADLDVTAQRARNTAALHRANAKFQSEALASAIGAAKARNAAIIEAAANAQLAALQANANLALASQAAAISGGAGLGHVGNVLTANTGIHGGRRVGSFGFLH